MPGGVVGDRQRELRLRVRWEQLRRLGSHSTARPVPPGPSLMRQSGPAKPGAHSQRNQLTPSTQTPPL